MSIYVNKAAQVFMSEKYQDWYAKEVTNQSTRVVDPHSIKVDIRLSTLKPIHENWIVQYYMHMKRCQSITKSGFQATNLDAVIDAEALNYLYEFPFADIFTLIVGV